MISYVILQIVAFILDDSGSHKVDTSIIIELFISKFLSGKFHLRDLSVLAGILVVYNLSFIIMLTEYFPSAISVVNYSCLYFIIRLVSVRCSFPV